MVRCSHARSRHHPHRYPFLEAITTFHDPSAAGVGNRAPLPITTMTENPLSTYTGPNTALAAVEGQRAVQEVQAAMVIAKRFPRDEKAALDRILNSCTRVTLAEQSLYSFSRGGSEITGPSIRLMEAIAQHWGNLEFGFREIERGVDAAGIGYSEVQAYAWDIENNTRRPLQFRVPHWRDKRGGGEKITAERDIYELVANMAQRRVRACLMAVIPGDIVEEAARQCDVTLSADADVSPEGQKKLIEALGKFGVTKEMIEKRIQRRIDTVTPAQVVQFKKIYASLRDGMSNPQDWFEGVADDAKREKVGQSPLAKKEEAP